MAFVIVVPVLPTGSQEHLGSSIHSVGCDMDRCSVLLGVLSRRLCILLGTVLCKLGFVTLKQERITELANGSRND